MVCEGYHDACFFERLIEVHNLPRFKIMHAGGKDQFAQRVRGFRLESQQHFNSLRDILIVADNNDDPGERFKNVQRQIDDIFREKGAAPDAPLKKTSPTKTRRMSISVLMIPWTDKPGHLERLCEAAARSQDNPMAHKVDTFMALIHAANWIGESRRSKTWLRVNLAARCTKNPFVTLAQTFSDPKNKDLIPVDHSSFKPIVNWLKTFADPAVP